jgi:hypothetical protein
MSNRDTHQDEDRNIQRMEYVRTNGGQTRGWWVRVKRGEKRFSRLFSDSKYGGKENALLEARKYRDQLEKEHGEIVDLGYQIYKSSRNKSGLIGVHKGPKITKRQSGKIYIYQNWIASWIDPVSGKRKNKAFAISKHGEAGALILALRAREEAIEIMSGAKRSSATSWGKNSLDDLVEFVEKAQTPNEKGKALEELSCKLFESIPGFSINGFDQETETEEIDLILLNNSNDPRFRRESVILLVECKNWSSRCGKNEFVIFKEKIENRSNRCSLGFLISWNGFTETITKEMLRGSREQPLIVLLEGKHIKQAVKSKDFFGTLTTAFDKAITL